MNITTFLNESNNDFSIEDWISKGLGLKRNRMPQIDSDHLDYCLMHFANKYKVQKITIPVSKLLPIQSEINLEKVQKMVKKAKAPKTPFLVSKDFRLCDGTHTAAALLLQNPNTEVVVYRTNVESKKLIEILNKLKVTYKKELNENKK